MVPVAALYPVFSNGRQTWLPSESPRALREIVLLLKVSASYAQSLPLPDQRVEKVRSLIHVRNTSYMWPVKLELYS